MMQDPEKSDNQLAHSIDDEKSQISENAKSSNSDQNNTVVVGQPAVQPTTESEVKERNGGFRYYVVRDKINSCRSARLIRSTISRGYGNMQLLSMFSSEYVAFSQHLALELFSRS